MPSWRYQYRFFDALHYNIMYIMYNVQNFNKSYVFFNFYLQYPSTFATWTGLYNFTEKENKINQYTANLILEHIH